MFGRSSYIKALEQANRENLETIDALERNSEGQQREINHLNSCIDKERELHTATQKKLHMQAAELKQAQQKLATISDIALGITVPSRVVSSCVKQVQDTFKEAATSQTDSLRKLRNIYKSILFNHRMGNNKVTGGLCAFINRKHPYLAQTQRDCFRAAGLDLLYPFGKAEYAYRVRCGLPIMEITLATNKLRLLWVMHISSGGRPEDFKSILPE